MKSRTDRTWVGRVGLAAACVALGAIMVACTSSPPPPPPPAGTIGVKVEGGGTALTVEKVERKEELGKVQKAGEGKEYLVASVLIENTGNTNKVPYGPMYFKLKDGKGVEFSADFAGQGDNTLKSGELAKGDLVRGNVSFEVDKTATGLVLSYEPIILFGSPPALKVNLDK